MSQASVDDFELVVVEGQMAFTDCLSATGRMFGRSLGGVGLVLRQSTKLPHDLVIPWHFWLVEDRNTQRPAQDGEAGREDECEQPPEPRWPLGGHAFHECGLWVSRQGELMDSG